MGFAGYGAGMMGGGASGFGLLFCVVVFIDLVLVGIWLWKQIKK